MMKIINKGMLFNLNRNSLSRKSHIELIELNLALAEYCKNLDVAPTKKHVLHAPPLSSSTFIHWHDTKSNE